MIETTGRALVAFQSCGCWSAVQVEYADFVEQARESARFVKETGYHGVVRYELMPHENWSALRNGVHGDLTHGCDHDPQWGGDPVTHRDCPRCWKVVKVKQDGGLAAHKDGYRTCSQVPWERARTHPNARPGLVFLVAALREAVDRLRALLQGGLLDPRDDGPCWTESQQEFAESLLHANVDEALVPLVAGRLA